jgi:hypothetical protein
MVEVTQRNAIKTQQIVNRGVRPGPTAAVTRKVGGDGVGERVRTRATRPVTRPVRASMPPQEYKSVPGRYLAPGCYLLPK